MAWGRGWGRRVSKGFSKVRFTKKQILQHRKWLNRMRKLNESLLSGRRGSRIENKYKSFRHFLLRKWPSGVDMWF